MKFSLLKIITCIFLLILFVNPVYGIDNNESEILVIGSGKITRENLAAARKEAISDALDKGIEGYLEMTLGSQGMVNNFNGVINEVIPGSGDVIENYHILAEDQYNKTYKILVSIKINEKLMDERLRNAGIITYEGVPLRVLFLVSQKTTAEEDPFIWWDDPENKTHLSSSELILHRLFQERGFNPVNRLTTIPEAGYNPELFKEELTDEDVAQWGRLYSSDVVIQGKIDTNEFNALFADIKVIQVENTNVISSFSREQDTDSDLEEAASIMDTLDEILSDGINEISPDILMAFKKEDEKLSRFDISLKGLDSLKQVIAFISFVKDNITGVVSVYQTRIKSGELTISVEYSGARNMFIGKMKSSTEMPFAASIGIDDEGLLTVTAM